jgi:Family of unknown function (DUF6090)
LILKRIGTALRNRDWGTVAIEFAIVVLGIFVALQAESWNQARLDRQLEQVFIDRLLDETQANLETLNLHVQIFEDKVAFITGLPTLSIESAFRADSQEFMYQLDYSTYVALPNLRSESYEELEGSGRLALLRDAELRSALASYLNDYRSTQGVFVEPIGIYRRLVFETLPGQAYYDYRVGTGVTDADAVVAAVDAIRNDPRFEAAANAEITYAADALFYLREFSQRSEYIVSLLRKNESLR